MEKSNDEIYEEIWNHLRAKGCSKEKLMELYKVSESELKYMILTSYYCAKLNIDIE